MYANINLYSKAITPSPQKHMVLEKIVDDVQTQTGVKNDRFIVHT